MDEVLPQRYTSFTCRGYPVVAATLQMRTGQTTSSVSSLTLGATFPNPGKAYGVFLAAILWMPRCPKPVRPLVFRRKSGGSPCCLPPVGGPERTENNPVDCFQQRAGGSPGRWPRSGRMRSLPHPAFAWEWYSIIAFYLLAVIYRTDDLIRLLTDARSHLPQPGEGLRSLPCCDPMDAAMPETGPAISFPA